MNTGFSYSKSVAATIPADAKKFSRLGVWGDFTFRTVKATEYKNGKKLEMFKLEKIKLDIIITLNQNINKKIRREII